MTKEEEDYLISLFKPEEELSLFWCPDSNTCRRIYKIEEISGVVCAVFDEIRKGDYAEIWNTSLSDYILGCRINKIKEVFPN